MKFPNWAPQSLVELYEYRLQHRTGEHNIENTITELSIEHDLTPEAKLELRESMYRTHFVLPDEESTELMRKLLSDERMREVWASINRRTQSNKAPRDLWLACDFALAGWRGEPKVTPTERKKQFMEIREHAEKLLSLMNKTREFSHYFITHQISDETITWLLDALNASPPFTSDRENIDYTRFSLSEAIPEWPLILMDVAYKAEGYANGDPVVRKPNSENADAHYFIRAISKHFQHNFGQPLHEAVTNIACVVLGRDDIDADLVRKLVR